MINFANMGRYLIIQTAFIGDVVLATALIEKIHRHNPNTSIDFLLRKGNEQLLHGHPLLNEVLIWNKKKGKYSHLLSLLKIIRSKRYDKVINVQRYMATGILTAFSGAKEKIGFSSNPLSFLFDKKIKHDLTAIPVRHEVERNNDLIEHFTDNTFTMPKLYPTKEDFAAILHLIKPPYITVSPSSVWPTKKMPMDKWVTFVKKVKSPYNIYLLGGKENIEECESLKNQINQSNIIVLAGQLTMLQSAALMQKAEWNYTHDSAPLHFCSAVNAPVAAIFCSTDPSLGYTPLADQSVIILSKESLPCRPCGTHGKKSCPLHHFKCGNDIDTEQLYSLLKY